LKSEELMAVMLDTEGEQIPSDDEDGRPLFDADLCDWGGGSGPALTLNVPMQFETPYGVYDSAGVVSVPLKDVLEEYLRDGKSQDGGDHIAEFAAWLHDYADRLMRPNVALTGRAK
jgi:hypothetical protein